MQKRERGITLIALVITIIILLILAGISISALSGSGLFAKAQQAKQETENAQANEDATLAEYDQWMTNYVGGSSSGGGTTYTAYVVGDEVELKSDSTEHFYVIKASGADEEKVTLLAANNINTSTLLQNNANTVAFCTDPDSTNKGYWTSIEGITYPYDLNNVESERATAINYAKAYGTAKGGTGRLMTVEEAFELTGLTTYGAISSPNWIKTTNYWLGSAFRADYVWGVCNGILGDGRFSFDRGYGVRPVIEISKSLIQ